MNVATRGLRSTSWSPYAVGVGIGILSWIAFATAGHGLGITSAFERTAALAVTGVAPNAEALRDYVAAQEQAPRIDWEWMLVVGVFLGSLLSATLSGDRAHAIVPELWGRRFGDSVPLRMGLAFVGGAVMMFGARLARGCTSGHGITGALQLAVASWLFIALAFAVAIATALLLYGRTGTLAAKGAR